MSSEWKRMGKKMERFHPKLFELLNCREEEDKIILIKNYLTEMYEQHQDNEQFLQQFFIPSCEIFYKQLQPKQDRFQTIKEQFITFLSFLWNNSKDLFYYKLFDSLVTRIMIFLIIRSKMFKWLLQWILDVPGLD